MSGVRRRRQAALERRDALHAHSMHFGPNMTPMVDIVMVILIFFMASAAFMGEEWFLRTAIPFESGRGVDVAKRSDPLALPATKLELVMEVDRQGRTVVSFLEISEGSVEAFVERVRALPRGDEGEGGGGGGGLEVVIIPSGAVPYRDLVRCRSALEAQGIHKVGIQLPGAKGNGG